MRQRGAVSLISVILAAAIGAVIGTTLLLLAVDANRTSLALVQSFQAKALAQACAEEALQRIHDATTFTGTGSLALGQGSCSYTVVSGGGQNRTITASGTVSATTRKAKVILDQVKPTLRVVSWQEVADF